MYRANFISRYLNKRLTIDNVTVYGRIVTNELIASYLVQIVHKLVDSHKFENLLHSTLINYEEEKLIIRLINLIILPDIDDEREREMSRLNK